MSAPVSVSKRTRKSARWLHTLSIEAFRYVAKLPGEPTGPADAPPKAVTPSWGRQAISSSTADGSSEAMPLSCSTALPGVKVMITIWIAGIAGYPLETFTIWIPILWINKIPVTHKVTVRLH